MAAPDAAPPTSWAELARAQAGRNWFELRTPVAAAAAPLGDARCAVYRADYDGGAHVDAWPSEPVALVVDGVVVPVPPLAIRFDLPPLVERDFYSGDQDKPEPATKLMSPGGSVHVVVDCLAPDTVYLAMVREGVMWITEVGGARESFELGEGASHTTASGQRWSFTGASHKMVKAGDRGSGTWEFTVEKAGKKLELSPSGEQLYAEGAAFGQAFIIVPVEGGPRVRITLSDGVRRPLTLEQARSMARKRYDEGGHPEPSQHSSSEDEGTFRFSFGPDTQGGSLLVVVGRHSGEVASVRHEDRGNEGLYQMRKK